MAITKKIKQLVNPVNAEEYIYPITGTESTYDQNGNSVNDLLDLKADLVGGKVPSSQLPAYVDDVLEYANFAAFPVTGESGKIYVALDVDLTYRWGGSAYTEISKSLALGETSNTAYRGDRGKIAYDHTLLTNNPHSITKTQIGLSNVDNISDANKPVSIATQTALNLKTDKTTTITAGLGLTGGGDLSADRTINVGNTDDSIVVAADNIKVNTNNTLVSTSTTQPLSANQGKVLNEKVAQVETDLNLDEYTIAEAFNLLYRKIISLETIIANGIFKNLQVDNLTTVNAFNYNGAPLIVIGNTAPTSAPDFVGQTYVNTTAPGTVYSARGNASVSDWKQTSN